MKFVHQRCLGLINGREGLSSSDVRGAWDQPMEGMNPGIEGEAYQVRASEVFGIDEWKGRPIKLVCQ